MSLAPVRLTRLEPVAPAAAPNHSYGQILKSSALIGGSSVINIAVSIFRGKAMALLLGPSGVGLMGLYGSILELAQSIAGMGINSSGVRQIAEAVASGDTQRIARTAAVLRRTSVVLGITGGILLVVFRAPISQRTFGSPAFSASIMLLALGVLFRSVSDGQAALIQGVRRIGDLARIAVLTALFGTLASVTFVYFLRERGVVPALVGTAAITLAVSWWHRRRIEIPATSLTGQEVREEAGALLKLGGAFMASTVLTTAAAYAVRATVRQHAGLDAAGLYQSAWTLGGLYVGFILQAMGSDFYPRLTGVANDHPECNRLVNEQTQIGLLLAGPGVIATLTCAPLVIGVLYASSFHGAVQPLRWICLGMALRVIAWPMGYIILAKNARLIFVATEIAATIVHVGLAYLLVGPFGVTGATMAFACLYLWHSLLIFAIVHRLTGFRWSTANRNTALLFLPLIGSVFVGFLILPIWIATSFGVVAAIVSGIYSLRIVCSLVPLDRLPSFARRALAWSRLASADCR